MTLADLTSKRLENVLCRDKNQTPKEIILPLKSDALALLENYFSIKNLSINISADSSGFSISILAKASNIKKIGIIA